jgi:hypothetical protein
MSGMYWGLTAMALLGRLEEMDTDAVAQWVLTCQKQGGGFGASPRNDAHLLYTLSAVQVTLGLWGPRMKRRRAKQLPGQLMGVRFTVSASPWRHLSEIHRVCKPDLASVQEFAHPHAYAQACKLMPAFTPPPISLIRCACPRAMPTSLHVLMQRTHMYTQRHADSSPAGQAGPHQR